MKKSLVRFEVKVVDKAAFTQEPTSYYTKLGKTFVSSVDEHETKDMTQALFTDIEDFSYFLLMKKVLLKRGVNPTEEAERLMCH
ncbi:hypothetical protein QE152_g7430 [Popillia japonica]|uniref:Uncharacterized protein n=1 Tax=Popillia japonica TaxID=7064 RepID=A0AAW1MBL4_POPJA